MLVRMASAMLAFTSCQLCACRFYDPSAGDIRVGDHEVRDVTMASLRTKFGVVPQVCIALHSCVLPFLSCLRHAAAVTVPLCMEQELKMS